MMMKPHQCVSFDRNANNLDIKLYLVHQLEALIDTGKLSSTANIDKLADILVHGADGMFLWAKLMINYLNSLGFTPACVSKQSTAFAF
jgi:hypothetical protein